MGVSQPHAGLVHFESVSDGRVALQRSVSRGHWLIVLLNTLSIAYLGPQHWLVLPSGRLGSGLPLRLGPRVATRTSARLATVSLVEDTAQDSVLLGNVLLGKLLNPTNLLLPLLFRHKPDCLLEQFEVLLLDDRHLVDLSD